MFGSGVLLALCVLAVGASSGADPADDPPLPIDSIPLEPAPSEGAPSEIVPRPIEEPEEEDEASSRDLVEPVPEGGPTEEDPSESEEEPKRKAKDPHAANEDWIMLGVDYLIIFIPVVGGPLIAPLAQGLTHKLAGDALVHNEYPNWWLGTLAGYGVFALSGTALVGGYALAVIGSLALAAQSPQAALGAALGGLTLMLAGVALVFVEPAVFYFVARTGVRAAPEARAKRIGLYGEPDEDDETPEQPIGLFSTSSAWSTSARPPR